MTVIMGASARQAPPWVGGAESTMALLRDPYGFIPRHCRQAGADVVRARLFLRTTLCLSGPRAARLFYDQERFCRSGATPGFLAATLIGRGGVQMLDGAAHRHRKALFVAATSPEHVRLLLDQVMHAWVCELEEWAGRQTCTSLYDVTRRVLARAAFTWAGVPVQPHVLAERTEQLTLLFDGAARGPWRHVQARRSRRRLEGWLAHVVRESREGQLEARPSSALHLVAWHRDELGVLLPPRVAAVELLNLLRPTVAVAVFIVLAAHALQRFPSCRDSLKAGGPAFRRAFVQEVRRYYPFFPAAVARVRQNFEWEGLRFAAGQRALLDLHGTNHDPAAWGDPQSFRPERFLHREPGASDFEFVPQGGADVQTHHRCPGESVTVALMEQAVDLLLNDLTYTVPAQDLRLDMSRLPALPRDGFLVADLRLALSTRPYVRPLSNHPPEAQAGGAGPD